MKYIRLKNKNYNSISFGQSEIKDLKEILIQPKPAFTI